MNIWGFRINGLRAKDSISMREFLRTDFCPEFAKSECGFSPRHRKGITESDHNAFQACALTKSSAVAATLQGLEPLEGNTPISHRLNQKP